METVIFIVTARRARMSIDDQADTKEGKRIGTRVTIDERRSLQSVKLYGNVRLKGPG